MMMLSAQLTIVVIGIQRRRIIIRLLSVVDWVDIIHIFVARLITRLIAIHIINHLLLILVILHHVIIILLLI